MPSELGDVWTRPDRLIVGHRMAPPSYRSQPVPLTNGMYLNVQIALQVIHNPVRLETTTATFSYQAAPDLDDPRPVFDYHYERDSQSGYPRSHLHVHATPQHYTGERPFPRLPPPNPPNNPRTDRLAPHPRTRRPTPPPRLAPGPLAPRNPLPRHPTPHPLALRPTLPSTRNQLTITCPSSAQNHRNFDAPALPTEPRREWNDHAPSRVYIS